MLEKPKFTLDDIKYAEDEGTFRRAEALYLSGKVTRIEEDSRGYDAVVIGSAPYRVSLSKRAVDKGDCECYLGRNGYLCKHMLALALAVLHLSGAVESAAKGQAVPLDAAAAKRQIGSGLRKLGAYEGPSRVWFAYQRKLATGAGMIAEGARCLPPTKAHAKYLWALVERISDKLATGGVDDSDGAVGGCVDVLVERLAAYAHDAPELEPLIREFCEHETGFGFEESLREALDAQGRSA